MNRKKIVPCLFLTVALCGCTTQTVEDAKQIEESKTYVSKYEYETDRRRAANLYCLSFDKRE